MRCDMNNLVAKDSSLTKRHNNFVKKPEFMCSNELIMSLPFRWVKSLQQGVWMDLPKNFKNSYKKKIK